MSQEVTIVSMGKHTRLGDILEFALAGKSCRVISPSELETTNLSGRRILFALSIDETGLEPDDFTVLRFLRTHPTVLENSVGSILLDGETAFYTKNLARELTFAANSAGCAFPGKSLVEATKLLKNFEVLSGIHGTDRYTAYKNAAAALIERLLLFQPPRARRPKILMLHASNKDQSNTLALGLETKKILDAYCDVTELSMRNEAIYDCNGCGFKACAHFAEKGTCFYGGMLPESVFPAMQSADALLLLCPNYNDAPGAHFLALNNRLNSLVLRNESFQKALYAIVVSGYSGGDIVAEQILGGFSLNKPFFLPPRFAFLETANDPGSVLQQSGIRQRIADYANNILKQLLADTVAFPVQS